MPDTDLQQACMPPAEQDRWISDAAASGDDVSTAVGVVMRRSGGRCNPAHVAAEIRRLRQAVERYYDVEKDWL